MKKYDFKTNTQIRNEKPLYFVCIAGDNLFEGDTITECKNFLCKYLSEHKNEITLGDAIDYYIGMYSITIL